MKRRIGKRWNFRQSWLGRWLERRAGIRERFCSQCNQPYVTSPEAKPEEQFFSCSAATLVYATRRGGRQDYIVRLGRWRPNRSRLDLVQLFDAADIDDLIATLVDAKNYIEARQEMIRLARHADRHRARR